MKIVVIGGSGLIGSKVVQRLAGGAHDVVAASPGNGVDTLTGEGLEASVAGAAVVIDVSNSPANDATTAMTFFTASGRNLVATETTAGIRHHVALSIVGADRVPGQGYYEAKVAQEGIVRHSGLPYTIVRSTQFMEFLGGIADASTVNGVVRVPVGVLQPVAADDLASYMVEVALNAPLNKTVDMAGPERGRFDETIARYLRGVGDLRSVVSDPEATYFGGRLEDNALVPLGEAKLGTQTLGEWLRLTRQRVARETMLPG